MHKVVLVIALAALTLPAHAQQYGFDQYCRPLPPPGFMMQPQAPSQACLQQRAAAARAAEAERKRQEAAVQVAAAARQAQQQAAEEARQERVQHEREQCESATAGDVRETLEQDPRTAGLFVNILDVSPPQYDGQTCRSDVMAVRGVIHTIVTFQEFNGKQFVRVRMVGVD